MLFLFLPSGPIAAGGDCGAAPATIAVDLGALPAPSGQDEELPEWERGLSKNLKHYDDENFQAEVLDREGLVLVDFWASLCAPCRDMLPILSKLSDDYEGKVAVGHLDILESRETPKRYGITMGPHLVLFKDGKKVAEHVGAATREQLEQLIAEATEEAPPPQKGWLSWLLGR